MVKLPGRDEYLLLPDRESVLKFKTFADFATEDDVDNQEDQRNEAWWGRMYMKGMPFSIQYFRGHFGDAPLKGPIKLVAASPLSMCDERQIEPIITNGDVISKIEGDVYLLATRGTCTFGEKAGLAESVGAKGIIYINHEEQGNEHPSAPDVRALRGFSPNMISYQDGEYLGKAIEKAGGVVEVQMIPIGCVTEPKNLKTDKFCEPVTANERDAELDFVTGGYLEVKGLKFDFLMSTFGAPVIEGGYKGTYSNMDGCDRDNMGVTSKVVIVDRGGCDFYNKTLNFALSGSEVVVVAMDIDEPVRPGVLRWLGYNVTSTVITVGSKGGEALRKAGREVRFEVELNSQVKADMYQRLSDLINHPRGETTGWPMKKRERKGMFRVLKKELERGEGSSAETWALFEKACMAGGFSVMGGEL